MPQAHCLSEIHRQAHWVFRCNVAAGWETGCPSSYDQLYQEVRVLALSPSTRTLRFQDLKWYFDCFIFGLCLRFFWYFFFPSPLLENWYLQFVACCWPYKTIPVLYCIGWSCLSSFEGREYEIALVLKRCMWNYCCRMVVCVSGAHVKINKIRKMKWPQ